MFLPGIRSSVRPWLLRLALAGGALCGPAACDDPARPDPVAAVEITAPATLVDVGQTLTLSVTLRDAAGQPVAGRKVAWSSSNPAVATVVDGVVAGRGPGTAAITASAGGKAARVDVTVETAVGSISVEPASAFVVVGGTVPISRQTGDHLANALARVLVVLKDPSGGFVFGHSLRFSSSAPGVAEVSDSGVIRGVSPGTAQITIRAGGATGQLTVTVDRAYTLTYLGTLPGADQSQARAINEQGQVAVVSWQGQPFGNRRSFVWENGRVTPLDLPTGAPTGGQVEEAAAINEQGQVAGLLSNGNGSFIFLWTGGQSVLTPFAAEKRAVHDLNDRGEIVASWAFGGCTRNCGGGGMVVRNGQATHLSNYGLLRIDPRAINDAGQITGVIFRAGAGTESGRAFYLASDSAQITFLPTNEVSSEGSDIDAQGRVAGRSLTPDGSRGYFWSPGGTPAYQGALKGAVLSGIRKSNHRGQAVGDSNCAGCSGSLPVLFRDGQVIRVNDLFVGGDWTFEIATDINDRGQIVGYGKHRQTGATGALLLTPAP